MGRLSLTFTKNQVKQMVICFPGWLPHKRYTGARHYQTLVITYWEHSIVWYHGKINDRIFYWKPNLDKYPWIGTIIRGEKWRKVWISIVKGLPNMNISPGRDPYTVFTSLLVSHLVSSYYPVLTDASFYHVNDVKYTHLNNIWRI